MVIYVPMFLDMCIRRTGIMYDCLLSLKSHKVVDKDQHHVTLAHVHKPWSFAQTLLCILFWFLAMFVLNLLCNVHYLYEFFCFVFV